MAGRILRYILLFQGVYYLLTAIWPAINLESFMAFAGPKPDRFIFWTVDLLILTIGAAVLFGIWKGELGTAAFLGGTAALAFIIVEVAFYGRISPWFLLDFAIEAILLLGIIGTSLASFWAGRGSRGQAPG